jgi:ABC-type uncharacterized transport system involved in gliding motility auxiliary subunit
MAPMHPRRVLLANSWLQLGLVAIIAVLLNTWSAGSFVRIDLTTDKIYSLDLASRALMYRLERPLVVKVYFTRGLQAPYNNHERIVVDKLEDLRAYSRGFLDLQVVDPTNLRELEEEALRFGIQPIQYRYRSASAAELKKVYMGVALVYGDRQEVLPAITQVETLEYDIARAVRALVAKEPPPTVGFSTGFGEPDLMTGGGPVEVLRSRISENYRMVPVELGGAGLIPEEVDALLVVGPQRPLSERALYQIDQFLMRGGALSVFVTNTKPDLASLRPINVYHGLEAMLGHYGVQVNRDVVIDRTSNGVMNFPVRQGRYVQQVAVNYPLIPRAGSLSRTSLVVRDLDGMLFPFVSSLTLEDPLPSGISAEVLAASGAASGRLRGIRTIDPTAYKVVPPGEERGSFPLIVAMTGSWPSYFAQREAPPPPAGADPDDPGARLRESAPTRLVVSGSADFIANNIAFVLNLVDWMVQDESLIAIRSKAIQVPGLRPLEAGEERLFKLANLAGGSLLLLLVGFVRWMLRRKSGGFREAAVPGAEGAA